jgi:hypothetical protein
MVDEQAGTRENRTSFRAVAPYATLSENLGPLKDLPGRWSGGGFNLIARPDFAGGNDIFLELNLTQETLEFTTIGSPVPNRGSQQGDIELFGVHYLQQITDATTHGALHLEPGFWMSVPETEQPKAPPSVVRLASIPHGDAMNAQGRAIEVDGPPQIGPANTTPFPIGGTPPPQNTFPEYDLSQPNNFRTHPLPAAITQEIVNNPNALLTKELTGKRVTKTQVLEVSTAGGGGVENIPFIAANADAVLVSATFWIETVMLGFIPVLQLQYTQTVLLNFLGLSWPHVSVATLLKAF